MKKLALMASITAAAAGLSAGVGGCGTPGYSTDERFQRIGRNWGYEYEQSQDDLNEVFLLDPPDRLTKWNIQ